jgi:predicted PurR-regulated permease PerM
LVVGLSFVGIAAALLVRFRNIVGPLLLALILSYFLRPLASWLAKNFHIKWRLAVNMIFITLVVFVFGVLTLTGVALVQQAQNLVGVVQRFISNDLLVIVDNLSTQAYFVGPFRIDLTQYDLNALLNEVLGFIQPVLGQAGGLVSTVASGTITSLGWLFFIILVGYFILADAGQVPEMVSDVQIPGYGGDIRKLGRRLSRIWSIFMRGQLILFVLTVFTSFILMSILGVRNALALAILAGLARFVPYIGPFITWTVTGIVAFFQVSNYFGMEPLQYVLLVLGSAFVLDQIFDNLVSPRLYGSTLGVHPAAVLVSAIIAANLIGFVGLLLAAPVFATLTLFSRYAFRKMLDMDPFPPSESLSQNPVEFPGLPALQRLWHRVREKILSRRMNEQDEP